MLKVLSGFFNVYLVLVWIVSGLIHLWTVYIAYSIGGLFWGVVSFFFPVISQIYWGFEAFRIAGADSLYFQCLIVLVVMWIVKYIFAFIIGTIEEKSNMNY
jgi:hypothetical protein